MKRNPFLDRYGWLFIATAIALALLVASSVATKALANLAHHNVNHEVMK